MLDFRKIAGEVDEAIRALESRDVSGFVERREGVGCRSLAE